MKVQRNQDDQRWKYRTYHLRRLCRHHLKTILMIWSFFDRSLFSVNRLIFEQSKFSETYRFLSFGVWVCRGDCRILGGRKAFRVSCGHQRGHQFLNFLSLPPFTLISPQISNEILFHDSVPSFSWWITELKIMKIMSPSKLILRKNTLKYLTSRDKSFWNQN